MNYPGKLVVVEGLEGAGKSTAIDIIVKKLKLAGIEILLTREPGGTEIGESLRNILKNPDHKQTMTDETELLLMYAARVQLVNEVILPSLEKGKWVIADRFELSSFAYQVGGRGIDSKFVEQLSQFCLRGFTPDLTIYLDVSPELGMSRAKQRGSFDRIEQESLDFFNNVKNTYEAHLKQIENLIKIDASLPLQEVKQNIEKSMEHYLNKYKNHA